MNTDNSTIALIGMCNVCDTEYRLNVMEEDYLRWQEGKTLIQDAFPYLSIGDRELMISGICAKCWEDMFGQSSRELFGEDA